MNIFIVFAILGGVLIGLWFFVMWREWLADRARAQEEQELREDLQRTVFDPAPPPHEPPNGEYRKPPWENMDSDGELIGEPSPTE